MALARMVVQCGMGTLQLGVSERASVSPSKGLLSRKADEYGARVLLSLALVSSASRTSSCTHPTTPSALVVSRSNHLALEQEPRRKEGDSAYREG